MNLIKGITWDHPRGYDSIVAATEQYERVFDNFRVIWDKRSLAEFGDLSIAELTDNYDMLIIDHPFVGEAHVRELLVPLDQILSSEVLNIQSEIHIGPCYASYAYAGHQYALPIDAAAQFCAFDSKVLDQSGIPADWSEYLELVSDVDFNSKVLWPLCPTDLWCSFLTLAAQLGIRDDRDVFNEDGLNVELASEALEWLKELTEQIPTKCWEMNPVEVLSILNSESDFIFSPLLFGYNNYGRKGIGHVEFANVLCFRGQTPVSLLGGAGVAVSSKSSHKIEIAEILKFIMRDEIMSGPYFRAGGQPSLESSWRSNVVNASTLNFFGNTIDTMKGAYVRPVLPGFVNFQNECAEFIHRTLKEASVSSIIMEINILYHKYCD